jgi:hypothetical protein
MNAAAGLLMTDSDPFIATDYSLKNPFSCAINASSSANKSTSPRPASIGLVSGIRRLSLAHSPKSISRQRSLQKGLKAESGPQMTAVWQVGHLTVIWLIAEF